MTGAKDGARFDALVVRNPDTRSPFDMFDDMLSSLLTVGDSHGVRNRLTLADLAWKCDGELDVRDFMRRFGDLENDLFATPGPVADYLRKLGLVAVPVTDGVLVMSGEDVSDLYGKDTPANRRKAERTIRQSEAVIYENWIAGDVWDVVLVVSDGEGGRIAVMEDVPPGIRVVENIWGNFGLENSKRIAAEELENFGQPVASGSVRRKAAPKTKARR